MRSLEMAPTSGADKTVALKRPGRSLGLVIAGIGLILAGISMWLLWGLGTPDASLAVDLSAIPVKVNFPAPNLALRDLSGSARNLHDFRGEIVLVNLWATWCPPCKQEMPVFGAFYSEHRSQGFTVLAINDGEPADTVRSFVAEWGILFPVWLDPGYQASDHAFRTASLPTSYVVDRNGTVRLMWIGAIDKTNLNMFVLPILEE